ncbi:MAG TPA: glycosyltransferase family 39 protein [Caulobacteraceae bacterium]|nr:glycosyltransferase family 39 protein [Caulobacteraceae bacterium]
MTPRDLSVESAASPDANWSWAVGASTLFILVRLAAIRLSPLQLYPDEAQYWLWSRQLDFGYFTKPPLVAWLIWLTTLANDAEPFVRLSSPLLHGAAGLFLFCAARRLYDARVGLAALLVYGLMPAVQLGAFVMSTDTPLVACLAGALWAYVALQSAERRRWAPAAWLGLALGFAFLAKYAALYAVIGIAAHLALSKPARRAWTWPAILAAVAAFTLLAAPNLVWNAVHRFASFGHLQQEAAWGARKGGVLEALAFVGSQFGVFGPVPFAVLLGGAVWLGVRRRLQEADVLLLCWAAPALLIVLVQAFMAGAKANWAAAAFAPGSILVAAWMLRWGRPRILVAVLTAHAILALGGLAVVTAPGLADRIGLSNALKGVRGGREATQLIMGRARAEQLAGPLTAVAIDERELFNTAAYYGRDYFGKDGPPLRAWLAGPYPQNQAELAFPLTAADGARVLAVSSYGVHTKPMRAQFQSAGETEIATIWLDRKHRRTMQMFVGQGFMPIARR